jgi:para-nitrobenzyl esterase
MFALIQRVGAALLLLSLSLKASAGIQEPILVDGGLIAGIAGDNPGVRVFKGIPFAAAPVGDLRWRPPQPVHPWDGVRKADRFGASPMQTPLAPTNFFYEGGHPTSEDCLYLNVWTAAESASERRPVLLWIFEGGLQWGEGTRAAVDGEALSRKGAVVVTINYRLNVFGFFAHPELSKESPQGVSGNYGLLDMIAAIKWTRRNIARFGGDPHRITIFGESAGSSSASALAVSPLVRGDIHGAIAQSYILYGVKRLSDQEKNGAKFCEFAGAHSVDELRKIPADRLLDLYSKYKRTMGAVLDGWTLPQDVFAAESAGREHRIPILTGSNANEGTSIITPVPAQKFVGASHERYGKLADRFLALYPAGSDEQATSSQFAAYRDRLLWMHACWARVHSRNRLPAYLYYFTHAPPRPPHALESLSGGNLPDFLGAYHSGEICYTFNSLTRLKRDWTSYDHKLADIVSSYWLNFAAHGDPNGKDLPRWPAFGDGPDPVMELGDRVRPIGLVLSKDKNDFWSAYYDMMRGQ